MYTKGVKSNTENKSKAVANNVSPQGSSGQGALEFIDNREDTAAQSSLQLMINNSSYMNTQKKQLGNIHSNPVQRLTKGERLPQQSEADNSLRITEDDAVATVTQTMNRYMGHTMVFFELCDHREDPTVGINYYTHLMTLGHPKELSGVATKGTRPEGSPNTATSGVTSGTTGLQLNTSKISIVGGDGITSLSAKWMPEAINKRSWQCTTADAKRGINKANEISRNKDDYQFKFSGWQMFGQKTAINCSKYGEIILKAAGLNASAGWLIKTPYELATGDKFGIKYGGKVKTE